MSPGRRNGDPRAVWGIADYDWFCTCPEPMLGTYNECGRCHRKPRALLGVMEQR